MILKENDFDHYIIKEFSEPNGGEAKDTHNNNLVKEKRIIVGSIKDHLIPHASSFKTPKEVFYALRNIFEGNNINQKMTLRNLLKNVKIRNSKTIQYYITSMSQIKEHLESIEENVE